MSLWIPVRATYLQGVGYLGLYNLAFVLPLLIILTGVGNRMVIFSNARRKAASASAIRGEWAAWRST